METRDLHDKGGGRAENAFAPIAELVHRALPDQGTPEDDRIGFQLLQSRLRARQERPLTRLIEMVTAPRVGFAFAGLTLVAGGATVFSNYRPLTYDVTAGRERSGHIEAIATAPMQVHFSDGTDVELSPRARGRIAELDRKGARVILEEGLARVHVRKRPKARWTFEAGPYQVLVTGTAFDLRWSESKRSFELRMRSGSVVVRGPGTGPTGRALRAGEQLRAGLGVGEGKVLVEPVQEGVSRSVAIEPAPVALAQAPAAPEPSIDPPLPVVEERTIDHQRRSGPAPRTWAQRVGAGEYQAVLREASRRGFARVMSTGSSSDLAELANAARYTHQNDLARKLLLAQRRRFSGSDRARDAAFLLGRIAQDVGRNPRQALAWYETYLDEAAGGAYAAEALGRKMTVEEKVEGRERACDTARLYLKRYPEGPYATFASELCPASRP